VAAYAIRRVALAIPVVIGITIGAFALIHLVPGDPARILLGARASPEAVAQLRQELSLDRPLVGQYLQFVGGASHLDFGDSIQQHTSVSSLLGGRIAATAMLLALAVLLAVLVAVPLAIASARHRNRASDHAIRLVTMVTFAMPAFWLGLLLALVFGLELGWLPTSGYGSDTGGRLRSLVLPAVTIALYLAPMLLRTLRSSIIETLQTEFVEAAHARGFSNRRVMLGHVLRNSMIAMVTILGINIGFLLTGAVVVENVFAIPGMGSLLVSAVISRDYPVIEALTLLFGLAVIAINLVTDLSYAWLDPRVRL
jgi:peptide/nickel transport system permease protein